MKKKEFKPSEMPYGTLAKLGLTREMVEDLPQSVQEELHCGRRSPVLPVCFTDEKGDTYRAHTRFSLVRMEDGEVDVLFYPQREKCNLTRFSPDEQRRLADGRAILANATMADGQQVPCFHQVDPGTNQILYVPTGVVGRNMELIGKSLRLTKAELNCLQKGLPISVMHGNSMLTVGIDLTSKCGVRCVEGDERKWREERQPEVGKYNFGLNGCWVADADGNLDYVAEEEYSEEMWAEMKRRNSQPMKR